MLKIDKLNIIYNDSKTIFKDAFIEIPNSSFISITGPSGSGKTTLLKFILGEINNSNGIMSYDNQIIDLLQKKAPSSMEIYDLIKLANDAEKPEFEFDE